MIRQDVYLKSKVLLQIRVTLRGWTSPDENHIAWLIIICKLPQQANALIIWRSWCIASQQLVSISRLLLVAETLTTNTQVRYDVYRLWIFVPIKRSECILSHRRRTFFLNARGSVYLYRSLRCAMYYRGTLRLGGETSSSLNVKRDPNVYVSGRPTVSSLSCMWSNSSKKKGFIRFTARVAVKVGPKRWRGQNVSTEKYSIINRSWTVLELGPR